MKLLYFFQFTEEKINEWIVAMKKYCQHGQQTEEKVVIFNVLQFMKKY